MQLTVNGSDTFVATGGKAFDASLPTVVFLHGAGMDHTAWAQHDRWFAHHGYNVLAPDLPGHGRSAGKLLPIIGEMADWTAALLDASGAKQAKLIGHSMGSLIALEMAARHPAQGLGAGAGRHVGGDGGRPRSVEGGGSQRPCRDRHGLDLGTRPSGRTRRQPCAGTVDAWRRAAPARTLQGRRAVQRSRRLQRLSECGRRGGDDQGARDAGARRARHDDAGESGQGARRGDPECAHGGAARAPVT